MTDLELVVSAETVVNMFWQSTKTGKYSMILFNIRIIILCRTHGLPHAQYRDALSINWEAEQEKNRSTATQHGGTETYISNTTIKVSNIVTESKNTVIVTTQFQLKIDSLYLGKILFII